ncbi:MAG TPA: hypothetical protein VFN96_06495 [Gemmatimonadales bacterium]|nr:hypothetical protein [Gemmatimonadales bacterium]
MNLSSRFVGVLLWTALGAGLGAVAPPNPLGLTNDGAQYLSGARNLRAGNGYSTSILHFDEHYRAGRLPSPQTVWPPAYPASLAALTALGLSEDAAVRCSGIAALGAIVGLTFALAMALSGSATAGSLAALWVAANTELLFYVRTPSTELAFMAFGLGALVAVARADASRAVPWIAGGLLAAAAMYTRYAGLFVAMGLGVYALVVAWRAPGSWRERARPVLGLLPGAALIAGLLLRNLVLAGDLKGGNSKTVSQSIPGLLRETVVGLADGLGGTSLSDLRAGGLRALLAAGGALALVVAGLLVLRFWKELRRPGALPVLLVAVLYTAGVIAISSRTMLTFGLRYLLPVLPCLVVLALAGAWKASRAARALALGAAVLAAGAGIGAYGRRLEVREKAGPAAVDGALLTWARSPESAGRILGVGLSQAQAFLLDREVLLVPHSFFTGAPWDRSQVDAVVSRYGVRWVVVGRVRDPQAWPGFARELLAGRVPGWLRPAARGPGADVFSVEKAAAGPVP